MWTFDSDTEPGYWVAVASPTTATLRDVTDTANGPVAVGNTGVAVGRGRERWGIILEDGPGAKGNTLYAVDTTDDGERVWFAGAGGALGYYDIVEDERRDYSVPRGNANTFYALAVAGNRGEEKFLVADGSGHVLPGEAEGTEADWSWSTSVEGGNTIQALTHDEDGYGYAVTNSAVYMTTEDEEWTRIGVDGSQSSFYDCSYGDGKFITGGGGGTVYEADKLTDHDDEVVWTPTDIGGFGVYGVDAGNGGQVACGEGGNIHVRTVGGDWERGLYDGTETFRAAMMGEQMVAVGASGLIVERRSSNEASDRVKSKYDRGNDAGTEGSDTNHEGDDGDSGNDEADPPDEPDDGTSGSEPAGPEADESRSDIDWSDADREGGSSTPSGGTTDSSGGHSGSADETRTVGGSGDSADGSESEAVLEWTEEPTPGDGDSFDGRGETYDGDDNPPREIDGRPTATAESTAGSGTDASDRPDAPDEDEPDDADPADEDTDSDADSPDS